MQAVASGQDATTTWLLEHGADVNATTEGGRTSVHLAAEAGSASGLAVLLAAPGVELNKADVNGYTPLHVAAQAGQGDSCATLIK